MKYVVLALLMISLMMISCGDTVEVVPDDSDIQIELPNEFNFIFYRDALNFNLKLTIQSLQKYSLEYRYGINVEAKINDREITLNLIELRGYENPDYDGSSSDIAMAFINIGLLEKENYTLTINHPKLGSFKTDLSKLTDQIQINVTQENSFANINSDKILFLPENYFWGTFSIAKNSQYTFADYTKALLEAGAQNKPIPAGYYSYFYVNDAGLIIDERYESDENFTYTYYFYYPTIQNYTDIKTAIYKELPNVVSVSNFNYDGDYFPVK